MRDVVVILGIGALIGLGGWLLGSIALRVAGLLIVLAGLVTTATGNPQGLIVAGFGLLLWLAGHWLYGLRHHYFVSPLARRLFQQGPLRRIDPTRGWGVHTVGSHLDNDWR